VVGSERQRFGNTAACIGECAAEGENSGGAFFGSADEALAFGLA